MNQMKKDGMKSPFLIKKIDESISLQSIDVSAKVIKTRALRLLEWGILAPLNELDDPIPSLVEISQEFWVEKIEFFKHVAKELTTLGVLEQISDINFNITEMGKKLYSMNKMVSDPRNIKFSMYYEPQSKEWLIGAQKLGSSINEDNETQIQSSYNVPDYIPDGLIDQHIELIKILNDNEERIEHEILSTSDVDITVQADVLLTNQGIDVRVTEHPFGDRHRKLISQILRTKLIKEKELNRHLEEYAESITGFNDIEVIQPHKLPEGSKLFSPFDISGAVSEHLISKPSWIIVNHQDCIEAIKNNANKPDITIFLKNEDESFETTSNLDTSYTIIPKFVELILPDTINIISSGSIYSEKKISKINIIEADGYYIPVFVIQSNGNPDCVKELLENLIAEIDKDAINIKLKIARFYLNPTEESFNEIIAKIPTDTIQNHDSAKKGLQEIIYLKNKIQSCNFTDESSAAVYIKIINHLVWDDLIEFDVDIMVHCRTLYSNRLKSVESFSVLTENKFWTNINNNIENIGKIYRDLQVLKSKLDKKGYYSLYGMLSNVIVESVQKCKHYVEMQINMFPNPSSTKDIKDVFKNISELYNDTELNAYFIKHIKSFISIETSMIDAEDLLDIQLYFNQQGFQPKDEELNIIFDKIYKNIDIDFFKPNSVRKLIETYNKFNSIKSDFYVKNPMEGYLPNQIKKSKNKEQIQHLLNNLADLSKKQIISKQYLQRIINDQSNILLKSDNFEDLQLWLFLLSSTKRLIESPLKINILEISGDKIWDTVHPHIDKEPNHIKKIKKDLTILGLNAKVQKIENEITGNIVKSVDVNKINVNKNVNQKTKLNKMLPINRIVVDGSNVAREGLNDQHGSAEQLLNAYNTLKNDFGFKNIVIIIGAGLRHHTSDFSKLEPLIKQNIIRVAPAGTSDDFYIIQYAVDNDMLILTNDMYRNFKDKDSEWKTQIEMRRVTFMVNPEDKTISLGQFPNYKKEE